METMEQRLDPDSDTYICVHFNQSLPSAPVLTPRIIFGTPLSFQEDLDASKFCIDLGACSEDVSSIDFGLMERRMKGEL